MWEVGRQGSTPCHRRHRHVRGREGHGKQVIAAAAAASTFGRPFAQIPSTAPALQSVCARGARALPASSIRRIRRGRPTVACAPSRRHASGRLRKRRRAGGGAVPPTAGGARCRAAIPPARYMVKHSKSSMLIRAGIASSMPRPQAPYGPCWIVRHRPHESLSRDWTRPRLICNRSATICSTVLTFRLAQNAFRRSRILPRPGHVLEESPAA